MLCFAHCKNVLITCRVPQQVKALATKPDNPRSILWVLIERTLTGCPLTCTFQSGAIWKEKEKKESKSLKNLTSNLSQVLLRAKSNVSHWTLTNHLFHSWWTWTLTQTTQPTPCAVRPAAARRTSSMPGLLFPGYAFLLLGSYHNPRTSWHPSNFTVKG